MGMACRIPGITPEQQKGIMDIVAQFGPTDGIKFDHYKTDWDFD